ncbi:hypothetical protein [Geopseudomonas aromaticivorans]
MVMLQMVSPGELARHPYDPALLAFEHQGRLVANPFLSACGRYAVDPAIYGFTLVSTGGGCSAMVLELADGGSIWLTDETGALAPDVELWHEASISRFDAEGRQLVWAHLRDVPLTVDPWGEQPALVMEF